MSLFFKKLVQISMVSSRGMLSMSSGMSEETQRHLKSVETRPGIICGSCKVDKNCVDGFPPFKRILSGLETHTYKLEKYLVPILGQLTTNKYTNKELFNFATEIV